ncbi:hypothetical protein C8K11_103416 [Novosphingobium sp. GV055]|uniref:hypothetical protein n=2 Tax=Novosphingobium TaxID=165696 RepID=UPI000D306D54|nr:hypothetical protein [Novosphingobium sp. GV055]PTR12488.1 hypothetical protein C8K11_103416 [Novosphingobium sp. GV055]PUB05889.1 hypothetical protein C8K12_103416 [Novosphingobium sp. GV061]PUB22122.1 hypothetical protein C8K14_103416 [Novosphingobium sp. GV079]PUB43895.1 hypothetical protein C8K10_103416 [Novosphingobium sp. GV027]
MMRRVPFALATRGVMLLALCHAPLVQAAAPPPISPPASCLDSPTFEAARFHQFQTMMMTVSLRCKSHGMDVESSFSRMMIVHQGVFAAADKAIRGYISPAHGFADKRAFDSYATLVANRYGGGATNLQACTAIDRAIKTVTADITGTTLRFVATAMVAHPEMERMACALVGQPTRPGTTPAPPAAAGAATIAMASPAAPRPGK